MLFCQVSCKYNHLLNYCLFLGLRKKLRRVCLPVAFTLLALFILGVARHSPAPILTELGFATASGLAFFIGLYVPVKE